MPEELKKAIDDEPVTSPCVRNCCLDKNDICMGCFRHLSEITSWQSMPNASREDVLSLCKARQYSYEQRHNYNDNWLK